MTARAPNRRAIALMPEYETFLRHRPCEKLGISGLHLVKLLENGKIHSRRSLEETIFEYGF